MINSYKELTVWQKSIDLVEKTYKFSEKMPKEELYNLTNQMRRAVISIPSNIAEGYRRNHTAEYKHFLGIARGSAAELDTQFVLVKRLYPKIDLIETENLLFEVQKMLSSMIKTLNPKP